MQAAECDCGHAMTRHAPGDAWATGAGYCLVEACLCALYAPPSIARPPAGAAPTTHTRTIPPWWYWPIAEGMARCVFVYDTMQPRLHVGDLLRLVLDTGTGTAGPTLLRRMTHLYSGAPLPSGCVCASIALLEGEERT